MEIKRTQFLSEAEMLLLKYLHTAFGFLSRHENVHVNVALLILWLWYLTSCCRKNMAVIALMSISGNVQEVLIIPDSSANVNAGLRCRTSIGQDICIC